MALSSRETTLKSLPSFSEFYAPRLDLAKVAEAIQGLPEGPNLAEYDAADAKEMVWAAAEKFLARDLYDLQIEGVEAPYLTTVTFPEGSQDYRGIKDLTGVLRGRLNVTKKYAGKKVVIDWKTTHNTLDKDWDDRLTDSWQWRKYLYFEGADVMLYRGISRDGKTRELLIPRPANLEDDLMFQLRGVAAERNQLVTLGLEVWPRRMPGSCGAFGRECPYFYDCRDGSMPRAAVPAGKTLSYSSMDKFLLCPERYRREATAGEQEDTEESLFGQAVHRGMAEIYIQAKQLFQDENN